MHRYLCRTGRDRVCFLYSNLTCLSLKRILSNMKSESQLAASRKLGQYLQKIDKQIRLKADRIIEQADLTVSQDAVLNYLMTREGEEVSQTDVQNAFGLTNPAVTKMCHRLEQKEMIHIEVSPRDMRLRLLSVTEKGKTALKKADVLKIPFEVTTLEGFSEAETEQLLSYMERIWQNISSTNR